MTTSRLAVVTAFALSGCSVIVATAGTQLEVGLLINAAAAVILVLLIPATDLAFTSRRRTVLHPAVVPGMVRVHVMASLVGSAWVLTVVSLAVLVDWPDAVVSAAMGTLALGALVLAMAVSRHRRAQFRNTPTTRMGVSAARIGEDLGVRPS